MRQAVFMQSFARSPESIWAFLADLSNDTSWRQEIFSVKHVSGTRMEAGAEYLETVAWQGLRSEVTLTIQESVPGSRLVVGSEGPGYNSTSRWTFEPQGEGSLVTLVFVLETTGPVHLAEDLIWGVISRWLERDLPRLEGHLSCC